MFTHSRGYIFNARQDLHGKIGVLEGYKYFNGTIDITFGVTQTAHITSAVFYSSYDGFKPLSTIVNSDESMDLFLKSRRGTYAVIGSATMLGVAKVNHETGKVRKLTLYTPVGDDICDGKPVIICDKLSNVKGFHHNVVSDSVYNVLESSVVNELEKLDLSSKQAFLKGRL